MTITMTPAEVVPKISHGEAMVLAETERPHDRPSPAAAP